MERISLSPFDHTEVKNTLFEPRPKGTQQISHYLADLSMPHIIYFAGERIGEDNPKLLAEGFNKQGINFTYIDPWTTATEDEVSDKSELCSDILSTIPKFRQESKITGPAVIAGRGLGAAIALELAVKWQRDILALIFESGLRNANSYISAHGLTPPETEHDPLNIIKNMRQFTKPVLFLHCSRDSVCPLTELEWVVCESSSKSTQFQILPGDARFSIASMSEGYYFSIIKDFFNRVMGVRTKKISSRQERLRKKAKEKEKVEE